MRIVLAIPNEVVRLGLLSIFERENIYPTISEVTSDEELLPLLRTSAPDILLLDAAWSNSDLTEVVSAISLRWSDAPILLLTVDASTLPLQQLVDDGVSGIIQHDDASNMLIHAIHTVANGAAWFSRCALARLMERDSIESDFNSYNTLTDQEILILRLLAQGKTDRYVANYLQVSERTVRYILHALYNKLGAENRTQAAVWAVRTGLIKAD